MAGRDAFEVPDDDAAPDPQAMAGLIAEQRARVAEALDVDPRLLFGAWGLTWVVGFTGLWLATQGRVPQALAGAVFAALLVAAGAVTAVHSARRSVGVRGTSARQGAMYGWSWSLSFLGVATLAVVLNRSDASPDVVGVVMTMVPAMVVAALYMAGGAMWDQPTFFALGAWIAVVTAVAGAVGPPTMLLVMAVAGGGGMIAAGVVDAARRRGHRDRADQAAA